MVSLMETNRWDAFICHASEDKDDFVRPLANKLTSKGLRVWYDELSIQVGDRISEKIEEGLRLSDFGVVVLSNSFFQKSWPSSELSALETKAMNTGKTTILPIWYKISKEDINKYSIILADTAAIPSDLGLEEVTLRIVYRIKNNVNTSGISQTDHRESSSEKPNSRSIIKNEELDVILQTISDPKAPELKRESAIKKFEKYSRDKILLNSDKTWQIIHELLRDDNREFVVYALVTIRNIINNDYDKRDIIRKELDDEFDKLRDIEIKYISLTDRIKDDVIYIFRRLCSEDEFGEYACQRVLYAIKNVDDDNLFHIYKMPYFDFLIKNQKYFLNLKPDLELLMSNSDKLGRRAQEINDEMD